MTHRIRMHVAATLLGAALGTSSVFAQAPAAASAPVIGKTYAESKEGAAPVTASAKGLPNIVWILLDDAGFGASSAFGGEIPTPTFERLANEGLRYTNFHTTSICSPTRAALLTGRNSHNVGMGLFPHKILQAEFPGYTGRLRPNDGTIAEYLRARGYSTYALGKWHLTPDEEATDLGPFDRWPVNKGFDHFFGFLGGATDQYKPDLVEDTAHVKPDGRHLNEQLADKAIQYVDRQLKIAPGRPFFIYYATGATHSPHQTDPEWLAKYKGKFDGGWDVYREHVFERQKKLGLIPANAQLPPRDPRIPAWNKLSADQKKVYAKFMEGYAAFYAYTDFEIGRFIDHLRDTGVLDNTAVFAILGDNGASKEGGPNGTLLSEFGGAIKLDANGFVGRRTTDDAADIKERLEKYDKISTRDTYSNYPMGWSQATNTPFKLWKADGNSEGGTRNPLIVHWPKGIAAKGEVRTQYGHVNDLLPTTLELVGASVPATIRGVTQTPVQGTSLVYSFGNASAPAQHHTQYFAMLGTGAIVHDGWKAEFGYRPDFVDIWLTYPAPKQVPNNAGKQVWELYDLNKDFNETQNLAAKNPEKLKELQALFDTEARANNVYPLINWSDADERMSRLLRGQ
jgi:arylsulfatase A-like enzyme